MSADPDIDRETRESLPEPLRSEEALHDPFDWYREKRRSGPVHMAWSDGPDHKQTKGQLFEYFRELVAERKADPQEDLISQLATESDLSDAKIGANCFDFILAGQGTMSELLSNALYLFEQHDITAEEYELDVALEEVLRYRSPLQSRARETTETVTIADTEIPAGETVILWLGAANRDPAQYDRPEQFVPDRNPDHLAFGSGPHNCIGAPLARLEAPIIMRTVLDHFEEIELIEEEAVPMSKASKVGFQSLPVETRPA